MSEQRTDAHPPVPQGYAREGRDRVMLMTPRMAALGGLLAFLTVVGVVVVLPTATYDPPAGENWAPLSDAAVRGRGTYLANGCVYCHSGFSRPQDVAQGLYYLYPRVSAPGDYAGVAQSPNIFGTQRTGPDLSQEGGMHPDNWHAAHYQNPRLTTPMSIMPSFRFWDDGELQDMIAFNQSAGGREATLRYATMRTGNSLMRINGGGLDPAEAFPELVEELGPAYQAEGMPEDSSTWGMPWMAVWHMNSFDRSYWLTDNPLELEQQNLLRGKEIFLERCVGCHGVQGDGNGPAAELLDVKPFDFTSEEMDGTGASPGQMYHRILTAGPGTAMETFGQRLSVEDIWRVVMFLRTIRDGGLRETLPTVEMYEEWTPPPPILAYLEDNPVSEREAGPSHEVAASPFESAARWLAPGMDADDEILVGGKLPMTLERLASIIEDDWRSMLTGAYDDAEARGEPLPPLEDVLRTDTLRFRAP